MTATLRIEHAIVDFDTWKRAFERDPIGRERSGVLRHRIFRPVEDPKYVIIDLDFASSEAARAFAERLQTVWRRADLSPGLARDAAGAPRVRVLTQVEAHAYASG